MWVFFSESEHFEPDLDEVVAPEEVAEVTQKKKK